MSHSIITFGIARRPWVGLLAIAGLVLVTWACSGDEGESVSTAPGAVDESMSRDAVVQVATTLYPLEYFAQRVGGELVQVVNLIAPGVEAHDFEPTPGDIRRLKNADVIIYNGAGFEPWMDRAIEAIDGEGRAVVEASRGLADLAPNGADRGDGAPDPHVWLDPPKAVEQVKLIRDALSQMDPDHAGAYVENAASLIEQLELLYQRYRTGLSHCRLRAFVTSHAAFGHLAQRYGLRQVSVSGVSPEVEPSPRDLARLTDTVRDLGIEYVMAEAVVDPRLSETLAREVGADLLTLHPLESLSGDDQRRGETYFSIMEANLDSLRTALECNP